MPAYTSYVLRVWRVEQAGGWAWRAMLEHISTGERTGFADLPSLIAFLQAEQPAETSRVHRAAAADADEDEGSWTDLEDKFT